MVDDSFDNFVTKDVAKIERADDGRFLKVAFPLNIDLKHPWLVDDFEWMWCERINSSGAVRLDNIPFFAYGISMNDTLDIHKCVVENQLSTVFKSIRRRGGHSTFRVRLNAAIASNESDKEAVTYLLRLLKDDKCEFEFGQNTLFAIDVPPQLSIDGVHYVLNAGVSEGVRSGK